MRRSDVLQSIESERDYQIKKWGKARQHRPDFAGWILLMDTQMGRIKEAWRGADSDRPALEELRKLLAIGFVAAEDHGIPQRIDTNKDKDQ
jgi:hypothetical protein